MSDRLKDTKVTRRSLLKGIAAAGAAAAVGPWVISRDALASSGELNIMMWSDYLPKSFRDKFTDATGITIKHTPYGSNEELLNKLRATRGRGFDLISPTNDRGSQWQDLGLLGTIDMGKVPTDLILPSMLKISEGFSWDGEPRHLPYLWGTEAMAWRTDQWSQEYESLSFGDLWLPEMKGKVMGRPHSMMAGIGRWMEATGELPPFVESLRKRRKNAQTLGQDHPVCGRTQTLGQTILERRRRANQRFYAKWRSPRTNLGRPAATLIQGRQTGDLHGAPGRRIHLGRRLGYSAGGAQCRRRLRVHQVRLPAGNRRPAGQ